MDVKQYLKNQIVELNSQMAAKVSQRREVQSEEQRKAFYERAAKQIAKEYQDFRARIKGKLSWKLDRSARYQFDYLLGQSASFRFICCVGNNAKGGQNIVRFPASNGTGSEKVFLRAIASGRAYCEALLAFDYLENSAFGVCYPDGVTMQHSIIYSLKSKKPGKAPKETDITKIVESALSDANTRLAPLLNEFGTLTTAELQAEKLTSEITELANKLKAAQRGLEVWNKIHLSDDVLSEVFSQMEQFSGSQRRADAILLKGTPGTGKTLLAESIARAAGVSFIKAGINTLKQSNIGASALAVRDLWSNARGLKPCIVFIDECDAVFAKRGSPNADAVTQEITNAFLSEWTGKESGVWLIGATNRRDIMDDAILSRFASELELHQPDEKARPAIFWQEMKQAGCNVPLPKNVAALTQGMSGRDIAMLASKYSRNPTCDFPALVRQFRGMGNPDVEASATWDTLVLDDQTMENLQTTCAMLRESEAWIAKGLTIPSGILLDGPAGTGKTQIARTIANESGLGFVKAAAADIKGMYLGHSAAMVRDLFEKARAAAPSVLFIDELDIVAPARSGVGNDPLVKEVISQMLQEMDGVVARRAQVFVLAATNHPGSIDPAILSRFTERIHVPLPSLEGRVRLLTIMLDKAKADQIQVEQLEYLGQLSEGLSGRDIKNWLAKAQKGAVARAVKTGGAAAYCFTFDDLANSLPAPVGAGSAKA